MAVIFDEVVGSVEPEQRPTERQETGVPEAPHPPPEDLRTQLRRMKEREERLRTE